MQQEPEADLLFPDAAVLRDGGYDGEDTIARRVHPSWWRIAGTDASIEDVRAWYGTELERLGWPAGEPAIGSTTELEVHEWERDDLVFRLAFLKTDEWHRRIEGSDVYPMLFEMRLIELQEDD